MATVDQWRAAAWVTVAGGSLIESCDLGFNGYGLLINVSSLGFNGSSLRVKGSGLDLKCSGLPLGGSRLGFNGSGLPLDRLRLSMAAACHSRVLTDQLRRRPPTGFPRP
jgi:hypothetical protein